MPRQYYNEERTRKSEEVLYKIAKEIDFVLIGEWAVNFYTKMQKSNDVDLAVGADTLDYFKRYQVQKYENINIYFAKVDGIIVDLIVQGISDKDLTVPLSLVLSNYIIINEIKIVSADLLLLLKMSGYFREEGGKIDKDIIDVISLLFYSEPDLNKVDKYIKKYSIDERKGFLGILEYLDKGERVWEFITNTHEEYALLKNKVKARIKKIISQK